uniref:Stabilin-1 isoform X5 n=1 Tax=Castor canadensis TaxID=51338 RepID=A0A8B7W7D2_CASCN|nr:stabilin-1 isoform X5 [Castor canadensis]
MKSADWADGGGELLHLHLNLLQNFPYSPDPVANGGLGLPDHSAGSGDRGLASPEQGPRSSTQGSVASAFPSACRLLIRRRKSWWVPVGVSWRGTFKATAHPACLSRACLFELIPQLPAVATSVLDSSSLPTMAEPRSLLPLCLLLAFCLVGSSVTRGQKVRSKRCDVKTKFVTHVPCTTCAAIKKQMCPSGWFRHFPQKISQECKFEVQLGDSLMSLSGCSLECWKDVVQKACCPGYWGSECYECPGNAENPCNGHGTCLDGMAGNGTCVCQENFSGSACQECRDPQRFGPDCQSVCSCVHGVCSRGPLGNGSCLCFAGYTGPHCDQELRVCQDLNCPPNSQCSKEVPTCRCLPGYTKEGSKCQALDPCQPSPCSPLARCEVSPTGQAQCHCPENYHGDGSVCLPQDPCTTNFGGCPSNSTLCIYQKPGKAICSCQPGLLSINHNASAGCFAFCSRHSCDQSATCQVTPEGKTSCVCKEGEVGDGRACYGHLLHEVQRANQIGLVFLRLTVAIAMLEQGCLEILTTSGPFTVLVPSLSSSSPSSSSSSLTPRTMNAALAQELCRQHIIAGQHILEDTGTQNTRRWWTLAGQEITVTFNRLRYTYKYKDQPQQTFSIHKANYIAANGVFHVVTALRWQPPPRLPGDPKKTIDQILASTEAFSRFETILENCGLPSILDGPGPFTVFVPSNEAVDSLRDGRLIYLFTSGLSKLQELVRYHIYNHGQLTVEKLISKGRVLTMANQVLVVNISEEGRILLGPEAVPLRRVDVPAANGVIHMLEGILLPPTILPILPKNCDEEQYKVVLGSCVDCQALNTSKCPPNSVKLEIFPKECVYTHDPTGLNMLKKGCAHYCNQTITKRGCCKGFFGPDCTQCPGGFSNPCYGKGNCSDGVQGNGACLCFPDYKGIACHICSNPNKHGDQCQEDCGCVHGLCDNRPGSGGVCQHGTCAPGFRGRFCNESMGDCGPMGLAQLCHRHARCVSQAGVARLKEAPPSPAPRCVCLNGFDGDGYSCTRSNPCSHPDRGGCSQNAECVPGDLGTHHCTCHKGWSGDGRVCVAIDECVLDTRGGCHADALCSYVGPGQSRCTCKLGFAGDGYECSPIDPCRVGNGGCHGLATCKAVGGGQRVCTCPPRFGGDGFSCYGDIFWELEANAHFSAFFKWFKSADITLPADSRVTALVPSESAIRRLSPEDQAFWLQPKMLPNLVRAHFLKGTFSEEKLASLSGQEVDTLSPTTHWEIRNISGRVWVQNASVDVADLLATNGVLHILNQVLLPPRGDVQTGQGLLQQLDLVPAFRLFRELLQHHKLVAQIEAATAYTIFVPTNSSLEAQGNSSSLDADAVRHHVILGEALSRETLSKGGHRNSVLGPAHWLVFYNHSGQPEVNHVPIEGPLLEAPGCSLFGLSGVLTVSSSRCLHSHAEALREKCINCTRKFRCTQGFQLQDTPRKSCVYRSGISFSRGCSYTCVKKIQVPDCCPGFFGMLCEPCPGGVGGVCSGHGQCQDRLLGSGECRCHEGFHGTACEMCELGRYGPTCTGVCDCAHGLCQEGLRGDGSCVCNVGWQGLHCDQKISSPQCLKNCDPNANCVQDSAGAAVCICAAGYSGNGSYCSEVDPCAHDHGGCSPHANCTKVAPGQRTCTCRDGYTGDGQLCQETNACLIHHGGCHIHADCIPTGPQQVSCSCREGYSGDGIQTCDLLDLCSQNNGGCSPYAVCKSSGDGQRTCTCDTAHTVGDGFTCRARVGLELLRDKHASFFSLHLLEYKELKGNGPFTIFVPHADLMTNLSQDELARIRAHRQLVFRYHVVGCRQLRSQEMLDEGYATALSGHSLRFSEREGSIYLNDFARIVSSDHEAVNGVLHFIDRVLLPPDVLHWEADATPAPRRNVTMAAESFGYKIFSHLVTTAGLLPMLRDASHQPFTMLWPTDSALQTLPPDRQAWLYHEDHRDKLSAILRGHVIRNVEALAADLPNLGPLRTMHGTPISFSCSRVRPGELMVGEDDAHIVQRHLPFEGGLAYGIDQLLEPPGLGARCDRFETRPLRLKTCSICGLEPPCPEGSKEQGSPEACWRYYSKFWTTPPLGSLALRSVWVRPSLWSQPQRLGRGCHRNCVTTNWKPSCCPGHYGSDCQACPGGPSSPCSDHGVCLDGMSGSGQCQCRSGFAGTACELCAPGAFGLHCQACRCSSHGHCDDGLGGSGSCFCDEGWTGPHCEVQLELQSVCTPPCAPQAMCRAGNSCECSLGYEGDGRVCTGKQVAVQVGGLLTSSVTWFSHSFLPPVVDLCQKGHGGCSEHANCSQVGTVVTCACLPNYEGDGWNCRARNPCLDSHRGGCSEHADCLNTGPNTRRCECHVGYVGDGLQCLEEPEPPVDRCLDQPPPCHADAVCTDLHFQEKRAGVFHLQASSGPYGLTFLEAEVACGTQGGVLATLPQLSAAQQLGFHLCLVGWLANGSAAHPVVFPAADCGDGRVGVVSLGVRKNLSEHWDAYCYRVQDVACSCRVGFVGDGISVCNGKLLDVLAATANFSTFYGMLLSYANATQRGLDFLDFLDDELTYKTLFVPVNEGFVDNTTLSGPDLELHASNATFLSANASQGTLLPAHSGLSLIISDLSPENSSGALVAPGAVVVSHVIMWDIMAVNGIIHVLASPLLAPPQTGAFLAPEAPPVATSVGAVVAAGTLLGLVSGALYLRARSKPAGFGFSAFQAEDDADDDFSPWQQGTSPTLVSVPNPVFGSHDAFCEPFDDSLMEEDFPDTQRILAVK